MDQCALLLTNDGHYNIYFFIIEKKQTFKAFIIYTLLMLFYTLIGLTA